MKNILRLFLKNNWVELLIVPLPLMAFCRLFYGPDYFASWSNFGIMTFPWILYGVVVSAACRWWRAVMHRQFTTLDDWWKRLIFSLLGYFSMHVICISIFYLAATSLSFPWLRVLEERLYIVLGVNFLVLTVITTLYEGITFFNKWKEAVTETEQLEKLNLESRFRSLQSQLNPHFLFNSLNVLSSLIAENPRRAEDFVDELSNVYRYLLRSNEQELARVGDELRFVRSFFHLLQTRHGAGIALQIESSPEILQQKIPALALQVLVENAVKHNEISPEKPLLVEIFEKKDSRQLVVRNNVQIRKTQAASNRVGLSNLEERYKLLDVEGFEVRAGDVFFEVRLPLIS